MNYLAPECVDLLSLKIHKLDYQLTKGQQFLLFFFINDKLSNSLLVPSVGQLTDLL